MEWEKARRQRAFSSFRISKGFSGTVNVFLGRRQKKARLGLKKGGDSNGKRISNHRWDEGALCIGDSNREHSLLSSDQLFNEKERNIRKLEVEKAQKKRAIVRV